MSPHADESLPDVWLGDVYEIADSEFVQVCEFVLKARDSNGNPPIHDDVFAICRPMTREERFDSRDGRRFLSFKSMMQRSTANSRSVHNIRVCIIKYSYGRRSYYLFGVSCKTLTILIQILTRRQSREVHDIDLSMPQAEDHVVDEGAGASANTGGYRRNWLEFAAEIRKLSIEIAKLLPDEFMIRPGEPLPVRSVALMAENDDLGLNFSKRFMKCNTGRWTCCNLHYKKRHMQEEAFIACACKIVTPIDQLLAMLGDVDSIHRDGGALVWLADIKRPGLALPFIVSLLFDNPRACEVCALGSTSFRCRKCWDFMSEQPTSLRDAGLWSPSHARTVPGTLHFMRTLSPRDLAALGIHLSARQLFEVADWLKIDLHELCEPETLHLYNLGIFKNTLKLFARCMNSSDGEAVKCFSIT